VETDAQRRFLRDQRCQLAQGFLLGRPLPPEEVEALMAAA
jgi:EAL domain-containing protein (putative c-di-GMP-specific phosphodiesterase class I)